MTRAIALAVLLAAAAGPVFADPATAPPKDRPAIVIPRRADWSQPPQRTALESRAPGGATVGVGYLCGIDRAEPQAVGPTSSFGHQGTFLGAKMGVSF